MPFIGPAVRRVDGPSRPPRPRQTVEVGSSSRPWRSTRHVVVRGDSPSVSCRGVRPPPRLVCVSLRTLTPRQRQQSARWSRRGRAVSIAVDIAGDADQSWAHHRQHETSNGLLAREHEVLFVHFDYPGPTAESSYLRAAFPEQFAGSPTGSCCRAPVLLVRHSTINAVVRRTEIRGRRGGPPSSPTEITTRANALTSPLNIHTEYGRRPFLVTLGSLWPRGR